MFKCSQADDYIIKVPVYCPCNSFFFIKLIFNVFLLQRQQQNGALIHRDWRVKITSSILKIKGLFIASLALYACNEYGQLYMILITILKHNRIENSVVSNIYFINLCWLNLVQKRLTEMINNHTPSWSLLKRQYLFLK